ncbi:peptide/nickel transport system permease protein [Fictibacillus halophilus]|uniref:Peptide/nickel transport system permease protein n=1 Tax=Fictibacillus halophilus TaxID=1610490 RepID=A0ABV2LL62_9BACL|nr:ABC transporter permease subunit [Fictibacillus halophilus]
MDKVISGGKHLLFTCIHFFLSVVGIIALGAAPALFNGLSLNITHYYLTFGNLVQKLLEPSSLTYSYYKVVRPLFPEILIRYKESLFIFSSSFIVSLLLAIVIVYSLTRINPRVVNRIKQCIVYLEALPDILIIMTLQLSVVWLFKKTGILIVEVAAAGDQKIRALPIICLSIPTTIMFTKILLLRIEEEYEKPYVSLANSKGLSHFTVFFKHVLRNVLLRFFFFTKTNIWLMLSNLYIIEYFFNSIGLFIFVKDYNSIETFTVALLLIYVPIFIYFKVFSLFTSHLLKEVV